MYQKERKQQILYLLQEKNEMTVSELSRLLFTSESSIRRDLQAMELSGLVKRTHGGVKLLGDNPTIVPFASRLHYKVAEKKKMAKKALSYIQDGQVIFLDQSSSCLLYTSARSALCLPLPRSGLRANRRMDWHVHRLDCPWNCLFMAVPQPEMAATSCDSMN